MRFVGRVVRSGRYWAVEIPDLGVHTQGTSKADAFAMAAEALAIVVDKPGFQATVYPGKGSYFEISGNDTRALVALLLRQRRSDAGLSLAEVSRRLGAASRNAYARYEQGLTVPTIDKLVELLEATDSEHDLVLGSSKA